MANGMDDDIIEKSASNPISTACLIISAAALLGCIVLQTIEIGDIRAGLGKLQSSDNPAQQMYKKDKRDLKNRVAKILEDSFVPEGAEDEDLEADEDGESADEEIPEADEEIPEADDN